MLYITSPIPHRTNPEIYFSLAVKGSIAILKEATKVSSIKKVVITSSIVALMPNSGLPEGGVIKGKLLELDTFFYLDYFG